MLSTMTTEQATGRDRSSRTRERLLDAAVEAFAASGFAGTTTRDIASRAGMSPAAVYVHHATKEDLLFEISRRGHHASLEVLQTAFDAEPDSLARIRAMVGAFSRWHAETSRVGRIVQYELNALTPEHRAEIAETRRTMERLVQRTLEDGIAAGTMRIPDVKGTALALLSLSIDLVRWYRPGGPITPDGLAELHGELAVRMVAA